MQIARNYAETVPFRKMSTPGNQVKLRYFSQCNICALNKMAGMKSCSSKYKALEPREILKMERLVHSAKVSLKKIVITYSSIKSKVSYQ